MKAHKQFGIVRGIIFAAAVLVSSVASAATDYYWVGEPFGDYGDVNNWRIGSAEGEIPEEVPSTLDHYIAGSQKFKVDLGGGNYSIAGWTGAVELAITNGTLAVKYNQWGWGARTVEAFNGGVFECPADGVWDPGSGSGYPEWFVAHPGATFNIYGSFTTHDDYFFVEPGGVMNFAPTAFKGGTMWSYEGKDHYFSNAGTLNFPKGVELVFNATGNMGIKLLDGSKTEIGGDVSMINNGEGSTYFTIDGTCEVHVTGDARVVNFTTATIGENANVTFDVDAGKALDLSAFTMGATASVTKVGEGSLTLISCPSLVLSEGTVSLASANPGLESFSATGGYIEFGVKETVFNHNVPAGLGFKLKSGAFSEGDVFVRSTNEGALNAIKASLESAGYSVEKVEGGLKMGANAYTFNNPEVHDLMDPTGWKGGVVPGDGLEVSVSGEGVSAVVSDALPKFALISVSRGAELVVSSTSEETFPMVELIGNAKLTISGKFNAKALDSIVTKLDANGVMPIVEVVGGGVLSVPGGTNFKNVDFRLTGTDADALAEIRTTGTGTLTFGYAAAGETNKIAFTSTYGKVVTPGSRGLCNTRFAYAEDGGAVQVVGDMVATATEFKRDKSDNQHQHGFNFGHGMDPEVPFNVIFDSCKNVTCLYDTTLEGGAVVTMKNQTVFGSTFTTSNNGDASKVQIHVLNKAKLVLDGESSLQIAITANWANSYLDLSPSEDGWESLVVKDGSFVYLGRQQGNDKARITVEDGIWDCFYTH